MKKNYLLSSLILFCLVQTTIAQPYQSIFGDSTQFSVFVPFLYWKAQMNNDYDPELVEGYTEHFFFKRGNDTIFNGKTYQTGNSDGNNNGICDEDNRFVYVREDTVNGKIYSYFPRCNEEYLVCDLSLHIGDTFYLYKCGWDGTEYDRYMVADSVTYLEGKKVIYFRDIYAGYQENIKVFFMEGIGTIFGPSSHRCAYHGFMKVLLCVHKNDNLVYIRNPESAYGCDYNYSIGGVKEYPNNKLHIYPNPVHFSFQIKEIDNFQNQTVSIYNIYGQLVKREQILNKDHIFHIGNLCKGVYMVNISENNRIVATCKLTKL